ncbi:MAG: drug/metabolite transporter (DMT)-like permease [Saprospiraceae bacterium]|jgi:drug/metabolite transporter (DMT)-like permease
MSKISELRAWTTLILLSILWGTSFILIKRSLRAFSPEEVALLRITISGIAFAPFFFYHFKTLEWHRWPLYLVVALTGSAIPAILFATAQTELSSLTVGILNSLSPIFTLIIGVFAFKNSTSKLQIAGILLGFVGAGVLIILGKSPEEVAHPVSLFYAGLIILGAFLYATNVNIIQAKFQHVDPIQLSALAFFILGAPLLFVIPFTEIPSKVIHHEFGMQSLLAICFLAIISTMVALTIFYKLVQQTNAVFAASVAYLIPIVAIAWGAWDGEYISYYHLLGMTLIIIGVYLSRKGGNH